MKDLKELLKQKNFKHSKEAQLASILSVKGIEIDQKNIEIHNGILSFKGLPSGARMNLLMKKKEILKHSNDSGIYLRDIL
jgi:hypothetical protein